MNREILIVDAHSLAHRAMHAMGNSLNAPDGTPTGMIVGFFNMLFRVEDDLNDSLLCKIITFDAGGKNFRHEILSDYKSHRPPLTDDFKIQLSILQELLNFLGYKVLSKYGFEADDLIASCVKLALKSNYEVFILSSDKDLFQLLQKGVKMLRFTKPGISKAELYDESSFAKEFDFQPSAMSDYLAMVGDKADNIKGVEGIGEVTAKKLLSQYKNIEEIFQNINELPKSIQKKLLATTLDETLKTRSITELKYDILNEDFISEALNTKKNISEAINLASKLKLSRLLKRIAPDWEITNEEVNTTPKQNNFSLNEQYVFDDFKSALSKKSINFKYEDINEVWDLKTAYYMLHPDISGKKINSLISEIKSSENPAHSLLNYASYLDSEINNYDGLHDVMKKIDVPLIPVLIKMENHGIRLDNQKFLTLQKELESRITEIDNEIINLTGQLINVNSPQQVSWLLFEKLKFEPEGKTKTKTSYSTDASVLEKLAKSENGKIPAMILEHRELSKMLTGFVIPLQKAALSKDSNGIIHTTFEAAFTGTGRLSSRDPNLQNIPAFGEWAEKIKAGLIPVENENIFVSADYSQIELRILAYMSHEEKLLDAFEKERDIHTETASWVFGFSPEFVTPELRRAAKMINFGLIYGMSTFGLSERLNISRSEASDIIEKYFKALPNVKNFLSEIVDTAKSQGFSKTLFGRIRPVKEIPATSKALDRALINSPIQGTAADIARKAMIEFEKAAPGKLFLQVHDSLVCECKNNEADEISEIMRESMKSSFKNFTLDVKVKKGNSLANV